MNATPRVDAIQDLEPPRERNRRRLADAAPLTDAPPEVLAGVFLLSLAGLLFQVALTRLASAALNYHLAVLAVSAGVLGTGAGATWVACWRPVADATCSSDSGPDDVSGGETGRGASGAAARALVRVSPVPAGVATNARQALPGTRNADVSRRRLSALAVGTAGGIAAVSVGFAWVPLGSLGVPGLLAVILIAYPLLAAPYVCIGGAIALALRTWPGLAGRVYGADLLGAGAGCLLAVPVMDAVGPPLAVSVAALAALAGGGFLSLPSLSQAGPSGVSLLRHVGRARSRLSQRSLSQAGPRALSLPRHLEGATSGLRRAERAFAATLSGECEIRT